MGIENNTREIEVQNQELQRANREQIEQANKEHEELGKVLDGLDTLDNEAELDEISGNEDISEQDDAASQLDNNDKIEDEPSEQLETINNPAYNEVENNGSSINDVNQAVDAKEAYEAEIRDMSQDEYHDQKELDKRVEENGSEPNMTEPSVLGNDLHQGDVSNKETDNRSRLNEPEQDAVDTERSTEEIPGNDETVGEREVDQKNDISNEVKDSLENFNQERWERMSPEEQKEAITELRDCVATDLELDNKPEVKFYDVPDSTDFDGYSAKENAIYINEYNMGDARETADTIAHESRHCWQHELVEKNPDSPESKMFAENFDDYIKPQDDYVEYRNQPVVSDAREYASSITENIPRKYVNEISESKENTSPKVDTYTRENVEQGAVFDGKSGDINSKEVAKVDEKVPVCDAVMKSLEGSGLTPDKIKEIRDLPKPDYSNGEGVDRDVNKPDPKTYLNPDYYQRHLEPFEKTGCYRIERTDPMLPDHQYGGVLGHNSGLFVSSGEDMIKALKEADGDVSKLEKIFGMGEGDWGKNPVIVRIDDPQNLRIPDGNEMGAWTKYYIPGGFTSGNQAEAVIDSVPRGEYQVMKFNDPELMDWMRKGIGA